MATTKKTIKVSKSSKASRPTYQTKHLMLFVAIFALLGVAVLTMTSAKGNSMQVYGGSSCPNGVWTVDGRITQNSTLATAHYDVFVDSSATPTGYQLLQQDVALNYNSPYAFQFVGPAGQRKAKIVVTLAGGDPAITSFIGEARILNPCP